MRRSLVYFLIIAGVTAVVFTLLSNSFGGSNELSINEVITMASRGQVESIEVKGDSLTVTTFSGETYESRKESGSSVVEMLREAQVDLSRVNVTVKGSGGLSAIFGLLFNFLPLIFFGAVLLFMMRQAQGNTLIQASFVSKGTFLVSVGGLAGTRRWTGKPIATWVWRSTTTKATRGGGLPSTRCETGCNSTTSAGLVIGTANTTLAGSKGIGNIVRLTITTVRTS